MQDHDMKI